ncbi:MAG: hypothetical protein A2020_02445 [Lentisphaerae bacterium GWF2_45_14]|nr:MAG: hypothetical protein A2020_02445 [Lentisphaerae bacterium GWF2_45_14]
MTDALRTGIPLIDRQHEEFFERANTLLRKCTTPEALNEKDINKILDFIWVYIIEHFTTEEDIMNKYEYSSYGPHKQAHMEFRKQYMAYREQIRASGITPTAMRDLLFFMRDWFFKQIITHDIKLADFLKNKMKTDNGLKSKLKELLSKFFPNG